MNDFKFLEMRVDKFGIKKMTQGELASIIQIERNRIQALETSPKVIPKYEELKAYCDYFNTTADYLLGINPAKPKDEDISMISRITGLSDTSIDKLKNYTELYRHIVDTLLSSSAIDKIITAYIYRNSQFFQTIEIVDAICGKRVASDEEQKNFHLFQSIELLKDALNILSNDDSLFYDLNNTHSEIAGERMWKMLIDIEIEMNGIDKTIEKVKRDKKSVPKYVLEYIEEKQKTKGSDD